MMSLSEVVDKVFKENPKVVEDTKVAVHKLIRLIVKKKGQRHIDIRIIESMIQEKLQLKETSQEIMTSQDELNEKR